MTERKTIGHKLSLTFFDFKHLNQTMTSSKLNNMCRLHDMETLEPCSDFINNKMIYKRNEEHFTQPKSVYEDCWTRPKNWPILVKSKGSPHQRHTSLPGHAKPHARKARTYSLISLRNKQRMFCQVSTLIFIAFEKIYAWRCLRNRPFSYSARVWIEQYIYTFLYARLD